MVLEKYTEKFGIHEGITKFAETFNLVYLITSSEEALQVGVENIPEAVILNNVEDKIEETDDSDW